MKKGLCISIAMDDGIFGIPSTIDSRCQCLHHLQSTILQSDRYLMLRIKMTGGPNMNQMCRTPEQYAFIHIIMTVTCNDSDR